MFDDLILQLKNSVRIKKIVVLDGKLKLSVSDFVQVARNNSEMNFQLSPAHRKKIETICEQMLRQVKSGVSIYGTNTGYGGRVENVYNQGTPKNRIENATKISKGIVHVDVSTGDAIPKDVVRGAMLIRINTLLSGHSAVRLELLEAIRNLLNEDITPIVGRYGTVGASGDLALNGRIVSTLLQERPVKVWDADGKVVSSKNILFNKGIKPINLLPKEGLALVNGDNFSTSAAALLNYDITILMLTNLVVASLTIQALKGSMRNYHKLLSDLRPHPGQLITSNILKKLLIGSKLAYQDLQMPILGELGLPVQDPYSIRCLPQYYGPDWEGVIKNWGIIEINMNSVSDNPLWTTPEHTEDGEKPYQWVSGGNFLAMHMAECLDSLRKVCVHIVKQNDRHLARMVHPKFNRGLPANLSDKDAITQSTFKGLQTQMGMYEVYASLLGNPVTTLFGSHEEFNQDITSHAFTSAILAFELMKIVKYSIATNFISSCQAIDLRGGYRLLSSQTKIFYKWLRQYVPFVKYEQPLGEYVELIADKLSDEQLVNKVLNSI